MSHIRLTWLDSSDMTLALSPLLKDFITSIYINNYNCLLLYQSDAEIWIFNKGFVTTQAFRPSLRINVANEKKWWQKLKKRWNISINFLRFDFFDFFSSLSSCVRVLPLQDIKEHKIIQKMQKNPVPFGSLLKEDSRWKWISVKTFLYCSIVHTDVRIIIYTYSISANGLWAVGYELWAPFALDLQVTLRWSTRDKRRNQVETWTTQTSGLYATVVAMLTRSLPWSHRSAFGYWVNNLHWNLQVEITYFFLVSHGSLQRIKQHEEARQKSKGK